MRFSLISLPNIMEQYALYYIWMHGSMEGLGLILTRGQTFSSYFVFKLGHLYKFHTDY